MAAHAVEVLAESKVREVHLVGRRGPAQAKFTPVEIREFGQLADCDPSLDPAFLKHSEASRQELAGNREARKNVALLEDWAYRPPAGKRRRLFIHFFESPVELRGDDRLEAVVLERNRLVGEPGHQRAVGTGQRRRLPCGLFLRAIGFKGVPIPEVPYDEYLGVFPNHAGRIVQNGRPAPGLYAAGWIKRGPTGTIGTNKADSAETVASLLADLETLEPCPYPGAEFVDSLLAARGIRVVSFDDWRRIDAAEVRRGEAAGKPREKGTTLGELLRLLDPGSGSDSGESSP
jgi:ferredoxin--NADP+ reductase